MNKLIAPLLILISSISFAQEAEVWACIDKHSTGFRPSGTDWETETFYKDNNLFKIDGENSEYDGLKLQCETASLPFFVSCNVPLGSNPIFFSKLTGKGTYSNIFGGTQAGEDRLSVSLTIIECTKF